MAANLEQLEKATRALKEALDQPYSDIVRDATIQRFEFCVELSWKVLKKIMGTSSVAPKTIVREAAQQGLISDPELWLQFIDARNLTSHTYNEDTAKEVYEWVQKFYPALQNELLPNLRKS